MAVSIVASETISGDTFYRNKPFDISFSVTEVAFSDVSFYLGNSTPGIVPYTTSNRFRSTTGFPSSGSQGTLSVDVVMVDPVTISTVGAYNAYFGTAGCALDPSGYIYVANTNRHTIVQVDPSTGTGTVWAGTDGTAGDTNGPRLSALLRFPGSLAWDSSWNLYMTEAYRIRKFNSNGTLSFLAGATTQGYVDSLIGSNARFITPAYPLPLANGDILLPDPDLHAIRKVTQAGVVTTYAGGTGAGFADGSLASVTIPSTQIVRGAGASATVYDTSGLSGVWSSSVSTAFSTIYAIHCDTTNVESNRILYGGNSNATYGGPLAYQIGRSGSFVGATGFGSALGSVNAIAYDPSAGVYVAGGTASGSTSTPAFSTDGGASWTYGTNANLSNCKAIAYANGTWIAAGISNSSGGPSEFNCLISTDASTWTGTRDISSMSVTALVYANGKWVAVGNAAFGGYSIAVSSNNGASWIYPNLVNATSVAYGAGVWVLGSNVRGDVAAPLYWTTDFVTVTAGTGVSLLAETNYVLYSTTQKRFIATATTRSGFSNIAYSTDGKAWTYGSNTTTTFNALVDISEAVIQTTYGTAKFTYPRQLAVDSNGVMYLADGYNNRIRIFSNGQVGTYAGDGTETLVNGGNRLTSGIPRPIGLGFTADGSMYISSFDRSIVQRIGGDRVTTFAGRYGVAGYVDGTPSNARFYGLTTIASRGSNFYIAEVYNGTVRKFGWRPEVRPIVPRIPANGTIIATSNYPIIVNSRIDVCWTSVGGVLPLFKFEPFSNTITANRCGGTTTDTLTYTGLTSTELLGYMSGTGTSNVTFAGPSGASVAYPYSLTLAVRALSNSAIVDDVSTTVTIGTARIIYSPCNANLVFYRNEPSPAPVFSLVSSDISLLYSATTLPTGLSFTRTGARSFALTGTPTVQTFGSNYTIIAFDIASRTYTTQVSMVVNPERLILDAEGALTQSNVGTGAPIEPITFTARFPPYGLDRSMRYTWSPPPPAGIQFRDRYGTALSGSNYPVTFAYDPSFTLTLSGTVTEEQLRTFARAGCNSYSLSVTGVRTSPTPALSPSLPKTVTFRFGETIFIDPSLSTLYVGLRTPGSNFYYSAKTYFATVDSSIQNIELTDGFLPDGMIGTFNALQQRFELSGTPIAATPYSFTLTATNGNAKTASLSTTTVVLNDSVTVTSLTDACFNFIQYRSLSDGKAGFYTPPMRYVVSSSSGCNATLTGANLPSGVTLDACGTNLYVLAGRPTTASGLTTATLTGTVSATGVSSTKTFQYSVSVESFFFPRDPSDISFNFIQNVPITPVQLDVSTLSENSVIRFSAPSIPSALQITNTGLVQGTLLGSNAGTFDVTAFTAYTSGTKTYSYTVTPDQVLLEPSVYTTVTAPGGAVSIPINGYSLSAVTVSNYRFQSDFPYGLTVNSTTGLLSGTLASSLPSSTTFTLVGSAGIVDGSLEGTMVTNNLTVNRAQLLRNEWHNYAPDYLDISSVYTYSSDNNGLTWTQRFVKKPSIYASTIGTNGSNLYLIPTSSNVVLKTTDTVSFTSNTYAASDISSHATSIVNKPGTSTWWMVGTQATSVTTRATYLYTTSNDGVTWTSNAIVGATTRDKAIDVAGQWSPYLVGGAALAYKDGVLLFGGTKILRSTDEGQTWSTVGGGFTKEVGFFSLDHDVVWIATGSDTYETLSNAAWTGTTANTICYSTDAGLTWTYAANGFNMNGYGVVYGTGAWLAYGLCNASMQYRLDTLYSLDGVNWAQVSSVAPVVGALGGTVRPGALHMALAFDETDWKVIAPTSDTSVSLYSHPYNTPLTSGWTSVDITSQFPGFGSNTELTSYTAELIDPGADVTIITFPTPTTGPTFVSPAQSTYILWQYMPIPPITFSAPGATAYFVSSLPVGLTWNSVTQTITGACMRLGTQTFTVYAKNSGITAFTVTLIVNVPRVVRKQTSAGAYTALVRDYTEVNAAINARDSRVNPIEEVALGSFASPYAPDVVTPSNCPC